MANYYCKARTNYFKVKNVAKFKKEMNEFCGTDVFDGDEKGLVAVLFEEGMPSCRSDDYDKEIDFLPEVIAPHLSKGWACIYSESGSEASRYVSGHCIVVDCNGKTTYIELRGWAEKELKRRKLKSGRLDY